MTPNPCRAPDCRDKRGGVVPIVETDPDDTSVHCPSCEIVEFGNSRDAAIAKWNSTRTSSLVSRWPWVLAAAILLAAFIGSAING